MRLREKCSDFLDVIYFSNLVPNITSPTKLINCTQTLADNILSSVVNNDCIASNRISPISYHNTQLLIISNYTIT